jgi:hypothetical protein
MKKLQFLLIQPFPTLSSNFAGISENYLQTITEIKGNQGFNKTKKERIQR